MSEFYDADPNNTTCQCGADLTKLANNDWRCYKCGVEYTPFDDKPLSKERVQRALDDEYIFECVYADRVIVKVEKYQTMYTTWEVHPDELIPRTECYFNFDDLWAYCESKSHVFIKTW
jgi:hypothetical protein